MYYSINWVFKKVNHSELSTCISWKYILVENVRLFPESNLQTSGSGTTSYHLQRALPGGIVLMELAFQVRH